jgi:hypothetical protein
MKMPDTARPRTIFSSRMLMGTTRALAIGLALVPIGAAAAVPIWIASGVVDAWVASMSPFAGPHRSVLYLATWALIISFTGLKFVVPLLLTLAWGDGARVGFAAAAVWAVSTLWSSIVVVWGLGGFISQFEQIDRRGVAAILLLWICVEIVGTLAPAVPVVFPRSATAALPVDDQRPESLDGPPHDEASAPSAITADHVLEKLRETTSRTAGSAKYGWVQPDGSIRTSHRRLAEAFKIPKSKLARRLDWLKRDGRIKVVSTQSETRIFLIADGTGSAGGPAPPI